MEDEPNRSPWDEADGPDRPSAASRAALAEREGVDAGSFLTTARAAAPAAERPLALPGASVVTHLQAPLTRLIRLPSLPLSRAFWAIAGLLLVTRAIAVTGTAASLGSVREALMNWGGIWDAGWYGSIVQFGYGYSGFTYYATGFYPGWPMIGGIPYQAVTLTGRLVGHPLTDPHALRGVSLLLMANACLVVAVWALWQLYAPMLGRQATVGGLALLLAAPGGFFLSAGYSESSFIAASALGFLCAHRRRWLLAGLAVGAASVIRPYGAVLFLPLAILWVRGDRRLTPGLVAGLALGLLGCGLYPAYTLVMYGNPFLYVDMHRNPAAFGAVAKATDPLSTLRIQFRRVRLGLRLLAGPPAAVPGGAAPQGIAFIVIAGGVVQAGIGSLMDVLLLPAAHLIWAGMMLLIPLVSDPDHGSLARFVLAAWPAYFGLARLLMRWPVALGATIGISGAGMGVLAYGFARFLVG